MVAPILPNYTLDNYVADALSTDNYEPATFSQKCPGLMLEWSASSLSDFIACPRRHYYNKVLGWRSRSASVHLDFGKHFHKATELRDRLVLAGFSADDVALGVAQYTMNCGYDLPDKAKNRFGLVRSAIWYADQYKDDSITPHVFSDGTPAIETYFTLDLGIASEDGEFFYIRGFLDGLYDYQGAINVRERKTTGQSLSEAYFSRFKLDVQITTYAIAAQTLIKEPPGSILLDATQVLVNSSAFDRRLIPRHEAYLEESLDEYKGYIKRAEEYARRQYWPKNETSCFLCDYKEICPMNPSSRESFLLEGFTREEKNDPHHNEEDTGTAQPTP